MDITYIAGTKGSSVNIGGFTPTNHAALSNLPWTSSGHTGTASKIAGFGVNGEAAEVDPSAIGATTYIGLTDTSDTTYTGKDGFVPVVNEATGKLDLREVSGVGGGGEVLDAEMYDPDADGGILLCSQYSL